MGGAMLSKDGGVEGRALISTRTPELHLAAEQPSIGEFWIPPKKDTPCPRAKENPQQDGGRGEIVFRSKRHTDWRRYEGSNKTLCAPGCRDPHRD